MLRFTTTSECPRLEIFQHVLEVVFIIVSDQHAALVVAFVASLVCPQNLHILCKLDTSFNARAPTTGGALITFLEPTHHMCHVPAMTTSEAPTVSACTQTHAHARTDTHTPTHTHTHTHTHTSLVLGRTMDRMTQCRGMQCRTRHIARSRLCIACTLGRHCAGHSCCTAHGFPSPP